VKVLDFGLAKAAQIAEASAGRGWKLEFRESYFEGSKRSQTADLSVLSFV
jgi:hypothetical protein